MTNAAQTADDEPGLNSNYSELRGLMEKAKPTESGCLEWTGRRAGRGYGQAYIGGRTMPAHRAVLQIVEGRKLGRWEFACHRCDNPPCINPEHLFVGSPKENSDDMRRKGRQPGTKRGNACKQAKLTADQAKAILADTRSQDAIALAYGISQSRVSQIKRGKGWSHAHGEHVSGWVCVCGLSPCTGPFCGVPPETEPRLKPAKKTREQWAPIRATAWATRRQKYGESGTCEAVLKARARQALSQEIG